MCSYEGTHTHSPPHEVHKEHGENGGLGALLAIISEQETEKRPKVKKEAKKEEDAHDDTNTLASRDEGSPESPSACGSTAVKKRPIADSEGQTSAADALQTLLCSTIINPLGPGLSLGHVQIAE